MILFIYEIVAIKHNFLNRKSIMKCLAIKIFAWNFLQLPIQVKYLQLYA